MPDPALMVVIVVAEVLVAFACSFLFMRREWQRKGPLFVAPSILALQGTVITVSPADKVANFLDSPHFVDSSSGQYLDLPRPDSQLPRKLLAASRCLVFLWFVVVQVTVYVGSAQADRVFWSISFFTVWNFHLQIVCYFTLCCCSILANPGPRLRLCTACLFELCLSMSVVVSLVLWGVLLPSSSRSEPFVTFGSLNQHLINTLLLIAEFVCNRLLVRMDHIILVLAWPCLYVTFIWIQHEFSGLDWPYFFLELNDYAPLWYALLIVVHLLIYSGMAALSRLKQRRWDLELPTSSSSLDTSILGRDDLTRG